MRLTFLILTITTLLPLAAEDDVLDPLRRRLNADFTARLADGPAYARRVDRDCAIFPEGRLYPFAFPAMALARSLSRDAERADVQRQAIATAIDLAIAATQRQAGVADLADLKDYARQGTWIGTLALALDAWPQAGGDDRYQALQAHCCDLLAAAIAERHGAPIASYPALTWSFDTTVALAALHAWDRRHGGERAVPLLRAHLAWLAARGCDADGLPRSEIQAGLADGPPRGCDLSWRITLLHGMDPDAAVALYRRYHAAAWEERFAYAGFREYPRGYAGGADLDSGPLVDGIGLTATGFGLAASRVCGDAATYQRLAGQLALLPQLRPAVLRLDPGAARVLEQFGNDADCVSGFLFGDAVCFYVLTWPGP